MYLLSRGMLVYTSKFNNLPCVIGKFGYSVSCSNGLVKQRQQMHNENWDNSIDILRPSIDMEYWHSQVYYLNPGSSNYWFLFCHCLYDNISDMCTIFNNQMCTLCTPFVEYTTTCTFLSSILLSKIQQIEFKYTTT